MYSLNYDEALHYELGEPVPRVLGQQAMRRCRFCERDSKRARFDPPSAVVPIVPNSSLLTAEICHECQSECRDPLARDLNRFWASLQVAGDPRHNQSEKGSGSQFSLGAYKALVASALLILPDHEIPYFLDAFEWVGNPDRDADERLFAGTWCRVYFAPGDHAGSWASLARRIDDDAPLPYMLAFASYGGAIVQIHVPLCAKDDDGGDGSVGLPERQFIWGNGWSFRQANSRLMPLALAGDRGHHRGPRSFVER
jgi:hypothetical protein